MSEQLVKWLVVTGLVAVVLVWRFVGRAREDRRRRHFAQLAGHCSASMEVVGSDTLRFGAEVDGRTFEVQDGYRGGGIGSNSAGRQYVTFATPLRGRSWDLHDVKITPRRLRAAEFDDRFRIEQFGMRLPERWLNDDVRAGITALVDDSRPEILIEQGNLVFRTTTAVGEFSPERLRNRLEKQSVLARALELARN